MITSHLKWPKGLETNSQRLVFHNNVKMFSHVTLGYKIDECDVYDTSDHYPLPKNPDQFLGVLKDFGKFYMQLQYCYIHHTMQLDQFKKTIISRNEIQEIYLDHKRCGFGGCFIEAIEAYYKGRGRNPYGWGSSESSSESDDEF